MAYTTIANLKGYLNVTGTTDDALLAMLIDRAQQAIDSYTGRTFEASADATHKFTVGVDTEGYMLYLDDDLCSITSVITNADGSSPDTLATTEYITHPRNRTPYHAIEILSSSAHTWTYTTNHQNGVTVTGKWAWSTAAPDDIVHACTRLAAYFYRQKDSSVFDVTAIPDAGIIQVPQGIPQDVKIILSNYRRQF
jgi:hypothetical protein